MATKKAPPLIPKATHYARMSGMLAGTVDHLNRTLQELQDVSARCQAILEEASHCPEITKEDLEQIEHLKKTCAGRFDTLNAEGKKIEAIKAKI